MHGSFHDLFLPLLAENEALVDVIVDFVAEYFKFLLIELLIRGSEGDGGLGIGNGLRVFDLLDGNLLFGEELLLPISGVRHRAVFDIVQIGGDIISGVLGLELVNFEGDAF